MKKLDLSGAQPAPTQPSKQATTVSTTVGDVPEDPQSGLTSHAVAPRKLSFLWVVGASVLSVALGSLTGFGAARLYHQSRPEAQIPPAVVQVPADGQVKAGDVFGSEDEVFKDEAQGYLESGGIDGEGSHKLLRPGGASQTVYLTSSVTDLDKFVGMEIKVYGETYQGQKAGWLMDVGKVEVLNPQGEKPAEAE